MGRDLRGLDRIVAILLFLARLAEDAAAAPAPARGAVLWILRCADARVKAFAGSYVFWMGLPQRLVVVPLAGNHRDSVLSLALSLRILAFAIRDMIVRLCRRQFLSECRPVAGNRLGGRERLPRSGAGRISASCAACPDTS